MIRRPLVRHVPAALFALTAGCTVLSGLSDLEVADGPSAPDARRADGADGGGATADGAPGSRADADAGAPPVEAGRVDAGADASAPTVLCNGVECAGRCCFGQTGQPTCSAAASCPTNSVADLACDEPNDCAGSQSCCLSFAATPMRATCATNGCAPTGASMPLCRSPVDCPSPFTRCEPLEREFPPNTGWGYCE